MKEFSLTLAVLKINWLEKILMKNSIWSEKWIKLWHNVAINVLCSLDDNSMLKISTNSKKKKSRDRFYLSKHGAEKGIFVAYFIIF